MAYLTNTCALIHKALTDRQLDSPMLSRLEQIEGILGAIAHL